MSNALRPQVPRCEALVRPSGGSNEPRGWRAGRKRIYERGPAVDRVRRESWRCEFYGYVERDGHRVCRLHLNARIVEWWTP